jgi:hypothetical protein
VTLLTLRDRAGSALRGKTLIIDPEQTSVSGRPAPYAFDERQYRKQGHRVGLLRDGEFVAAAQEERFSRKKVFYDKSFLKSRRSYTLS